MTDNLNLTGSINYIKGSRFDAGEIESPLSHIPPVYGKVTMSYIADHHQINLRLNYNGKKPVSEYGGPEDNLENATVNGTPAWYTLNAYYMRKITNSISTSIALENLLDVHYRPFASGVSAPGRNLILSINAKF